ncbi:MAG TPA: single-stranded-DNA-specific exonuclease RecJ, partial [Gammaproteobacteria bacterium]|nr:single-stranded-DNA-specific exonuclease RecJ [Gammaproteobacteria bacterium]
MTRVVIRRRAVPEALSANGLHPLLARIYAARQVVSAADLDYSLARLAPVEALGGAFEAAALLERHLDSGRILVIGDFDADGATSTAVAVLGL